MLYRIPMTTDSITSNYEFFKDGVYRKNLSKNDTVNVQMKGKFIPFKLKNLLLFSKLNMRFDYRLTKYLIELNYEEVKHHYYKTFYQNNIAVYFKDLVKVKVFKGDQKGYLIPFDFNYLITEDFRIIQIITGKEAKINVPKDKKRYPTVFLGTRTYFVHRVVATVFVKNNESYEKAPIVNHIDGNKNNYNKDNLEWVSSLDNTLHAVETGLNKQAISFLVYDVKDGSEVTLPSLKQLNKYVSHNIYDIAQIPTAHKYGPLHGRYIIKVKDDNRSWKKVLDDESWFVGKVYKNDKLLKTHYGIKEFQMSYLNKVLPNQNYNTIVKRVKSFRPDLKFKIKFNQPKIAMTIGYEALNVFRCTIVTGKSLGDLAKKLDVTKGSVILANRKGEEYLSAFGCIIRPIKDSKWIKPTEFARGLEKYDVYINGEFKETFNSLRTINSVYNIDRRTIEFDNNNEFRREEYLIKFTSIEERLNKVNSPFFK